MKNLYCFLIILAAACGGSSNKTPDAPPATADAPVDAMVIPPPPALGPQIDRMGRPAINTALNHAFDAGSGAGPAKDTYNEDEAVGQWQTEYAAQFSANLGVLDTLDTGLTCTNGNCTAEGTAADGDGCGNQIMYDNMIGGSKGVCAGTNPAVPCNLTTDCTTGTHTCVGPTNQSYAVLASILADDQLYLDTSQSSCGLYLAVELGVVSGSPVPDCGGRAPAEDVMDVSYTALAIGITGFNATAGFAPFFGDGVGPHTDLTTSFPYLGAPH